MTRLAPAAATLLGLLLLACGGDDGDERGPNATATVAAPEATRAPETTTPAAPASTATPEVLVQAVGAVEPLALVQDGSLSASLPDAVVYEIERRAEILPETEIYARAWLEVSGPLVYTEEGTLARFDPTARRWVRLDLGEGLTQYAASPDGSRAAVSVGGRTFLLEFEGKGSQQEISTRGRPVMFSPAGTKLLLLMPEQEGLSPFVVAPVDNPAAAVRLPLGASPNAVAQHSPQWLNDDRLLLVSQKTNLLQVFDVSTPAPRIVLEETIPSEQAALSPDGSRLAVLDPGAGAVVVYELDPFAEVARLDGASLGQYLEVSPLVWSPDGARLLGLMGACSEDERLVVTHLADGEQTVLAEGLDPIYRFGFSPDGRWVAFTTHARNAYVVPADGRSPPELVSDGVNAPGPALWTADSGYVIFQRYQGGYDVCVD